jgi:hypothetical protein
MQKAIAVALVLLLCGLTLGARGLYVWTGCGYDCSALSYPGMTATAAMLYGAICAAVGLSFLVSAFLGAKGRGN